MLYPKEDRIFVEAECRPEDRSAGYRHSTTVTSNRIVTNPVTLINVDALNKADDLYAEEVSLDDLCEWEQPVEFADPEALAIAKEREQGCPLAFSQDRITA